MLVKLCAVLLCVQLWVRSQAQDSATVLAKDDAKSLEFECPYPYFKVMYECFFFSGEELTWAHSRHHCQGMGGELATPKYIYALKTHAMTRKGIYSYWLGATDVEEEGKWHWLAGGPINEDYWYYGQPNNLDNDEHCLILRPDKHPVLWDANCNISSPFICQYRY